MAPAPGPFQHALALASFREQLLTTYKGNVPTGTSFAIPPSVDINALGLSPEGVTNNSPTTPNGPGPRRVPPLPHLAPAP